MFLDDYTFRIPLFQTIPLNLYFMKVIAKVSIIVFLTQTSHIPVEDNKVNVTSNH